MISQMRALEDENQRLKKMYAEMSMQAELLKKALGKKMIRPALRRGLAENAVARHGVSLRWPAAPLTRMRLAIVKPALERRDRRICWLG